MTNVCLGSTLAQLTAKNKKIREEDEEEEETNETNKRGTVRKFVVRQWRQWPQSVREVVKAFYCYLMSRAQ